MIRVYDSNYDFLTLYTDCRNLHVKEELSTGLKSLEFSVPCTPANFDLFREENYIETEDYSFVIKEINMETNDFFQVYAAANTDLINGVLFQVLDCYDKSPSDSYSYCLQYSDGWSVDYRSANRTVVTYQEHNILAIDAIYYLAELLHHELQFDTKNRILIVSDRLGEDKGTYFFNELNLKLLSKEGSTYDYATVLFPIGKDGITIGELNNGRDYLENYSYTNKAIERVWINEDIDNKDTLLIEATKVLEEMSQPRNSYKLELAALGDDVQLGDTITIVDNLKQIKQKQRVVVIDRYAAAPSRSTVEVAHPQADFVQDFVDAQKDLLKKIGNLEKKISQ